MNIHIQELVCISVFNSLDYIPMSANSSHAMILFKFFDEPPNCFPWWLHHIIFSPAMYNGSSFSTFLPFLFFIFLSYGHPTGCEAVSHCGSNLDFPNDAEHLMFVGHYVSALEKCLSSLLLIFKLAWMSFC